MNTPPARKSFLHRSAALYFLALGVILFIFAFSLTRDINRPWVEQIDFNGAVWSQAAHNILRAGFLETQGASTAFYFGPLPIPQTGYYLHHPPLLHLGVAGMFAVFGEHEWAARIIPIASSLASALLLWLLVNEALGARTAFFCTGVFTSLPMMLRYGTMVNFEPVVLALILLALVALRYWEKSGSGIWRAVFYGSVFVGMWVDWAMHLFALVLFASWMLRADRSRRRTAWALLAMAAVCGVLYLVHTQLLRSDALRDLQKTFLVRVASDERHKFTLLQWAGKVSASIVRHYLWAGLLGAAFGAAITWLRRKEDGFRWIGWAAGMVFAMDAAFVGVFQNDSYIHEYIAFYFVVPVAILGGIAINALVEWAENAASRGMRLVGYCAAAGLVTIGMFAGQTQAEALQGHFRILDYDRKQSPALIPALGKLIRKHFSPQTRVLCNFMPSYGPHLEYYAERQVSPNISEPEHWKPIIQQLTGEIGGVVWMGDDDAAAILARLPPGKKEFVRLEDESFCVWKPQPVPPKRF